MVADEQRVIRYLDASAGAACRVGQVETRRESRAGAGVSIRNLAYCYAPRSEYPLAPIVTGPVDAVAAYAVDMDGTSTTTEPLALHALEYMVRRFTGRLTREQWSGLDPQRDYPNVIGHSNQHHTEYLLKRYEPEFRPAALCEAFGEALAWTLAHLPGTPRAQQVLDTARICGLRDAPAGDDFRSAVRDHCPPHMQQRSAAAAQDLEARLRRCLGPHLAAFRCDEWGARVRAALDVYYMRYHSILLLVRQGAGETWEATLREPVGGTAGTHRGNAGSEAKACGAIGALHERTFSGSAGRRLIEPMPGYAAFVATIKGWLGGEIAALRDELLASHDRRAPVDDKLAFEALVRVAKRFERRPARLALVTASIAFEAHAVMDQVVKCMADEARQWPISTARKERILADLSDYLQCFDAFITADDACEHRLKPHPDLYSLALARMGIEPCDYARCVGLEDTEPGIVAQRAAGIGCAVALPNRDTHGQDFRAAAHVITGGLPELLVVHQLLAGPAGTTTHAHAADDGG